LRDVAGPVTRSLAYASTVTTAEKLELVRRSYAAFRALDADGLVELYTPDCEWELGFVSAALGVDVVRGHEGLRAWISEGIEFLDELAVHIVEVRALDDQLLVHGTLAAKFKNGLDVPGLPYWQEIGFTDGRIARVKQLEREPAGWQDAALVDDVHRRP
jgi:ketosteroid isomerase-like protein